MDANNQAGLLESITLAKELKELIIGQARAMYGSEYPAHTFDVVISKQDNFCLTVYDARLIVYTGEEPARDTKWTLLACNYHHGPRSCGSAVEALSQLLESLYEKLGMASMGNKKGVVFQGGC